MTLPRLQLLSTENLCIYEQLCLEEMLFRANDENWAWINLGSPPTIVLGRTNNARDLIHFEHVQAASPQSPSPYNPPHSPPKISANISIVRRFSAGGTVVVDQNTLFFSLILNQNTLRSDPLFERIVGKKRLEERGRGLSSVYPQECLTWHAQLLAPLFEGYPYHLRDQDLCFGEKKIAGQAQAFSKKRLVHHSTFLIDYDPTLMQLLKIPPKQPTYRAKRSHEQFLTTLTHEMGPAAKDLKEKMIDLLRNHYLLEEKGIDDLRAIASKSSSRQETLRLKTLNESRFDFF